MSTQAIQAVTGASNEVRDSGLEDISNDETLVMGRAVRAHLAAATLVNPVLAPLGTDSVVTVRPALLVRDVTSPTASAVEAPRAAALTPAIADLPPETLQAIAARLGVDVGQVPRLVDAVRTELAGRGMTIASVTGVAQSMDMTEADAIAGLIAVLAPGRGAEAAVAPTTEPALILAVYVTVFAADRFAMSMPSPEALRVAAAGAEPLSRMAPENIALTSLAIGRMVNAMADLPRVEAMTAISSLIAICPDAVARAVRDGNLDDVLASARDVAQRAGSVDNRGHAVAAAFVLLVYTRTQDDAEALMTRAAFVADRAAPQLILSSARHATRTLTADAVRRAALTDLRQRDTEDARAWDDRVEAALTQTLDRLTPFLSDYDRLRAKMLNAVPRAELVIAMHPQLARGGDQFYLALLSLLKRHSALCTRQNIRSLRNLIVDSRERSGEAFPAPVLA